MNFPFLQTKRLKLVEITEEHQENLFQILSLHDVTKFYGMDALKSMKDSAKLTNMFQTNFVNKRGIRWGIICKKDHHFIGTIGLNALHLENQRAEIGYELHPDYWRMGYIKEALNEILCYSFKELDLNRMGAVVFPENIPSLILLQKMGFSKEGILRHYIKQNGQFHDTIVLSILRTEWEKSQE